MGVATLRKHYFPRL